MGTCSEALPFFFFKIKKRSKMEGEAVGYKTNQVYM